MGGQLPPALVSITQERIWPLSHPLLRTEKLLLALCVFFGAALLHRPPFCQELGQYLAPCFHGEQRDEFLDEQNRAALVTERKNLSVKLPECFEAFDAPGTEGVPVG